MDYRLLIAFIAIAVSIYVYRDNRRMHKLLQASMGKYHNNTKSIGHLLEEYRKFKLAFENSFDMMVITDREGKILYANESLHRITGFSLTEAIGTKAGHLWGKQMPIEFYRELWHSIKVEKKPFHGQVKNRRKDGQTYVADVTISPVLSDDQTTAEYFVAVERPVTA